MKKHCVRILFYWSILTSSLLILPKGNAQTDTVYPVFNPALYTGMQWRSIGPFRGGRSTAICGVRQKPLTFYMGGSGGGIWQTEDGGMTWKNISDGYFSAGSIGAIAVSESDPNILYAGTGEHAVRANTTSKGDGLYKSTDAGRTWIHIGLIHSRHISAIRIHPHNPDLLFVAVQGDVYAPNSKRGVYRSQDAGRSWERILYINPTTGAADLSLDVNNPRILYAAMWDHQRSPWAIRSGGPGSGLYKSTDGGDNWEKLGTGLPDSMGKAGIDISRSNPDRLFAVIEAAEGGVYRSDNGGLTWIQTNTDRVTFARSWYYNKVVIDPQDEETVYVLNAPLLRSIDGGKTFQHLEHPHTDQHALWIHPDNPHYLGLGNDGGATISLNGGKSWSPQNNQPTGQLYRVLTDHTYPYKIYTAQQDHNTLAIASSSMGDGITERDWSVVGPGESGFVALNPENPETIYSSGYLGYITAFSRATQTMKNIVAYPVSALAQAPQHLKYRFNWNAPLIMDPHKKGVLYHGAQHVLRSIDGGITWSTISPDLTRNQLEKQGQGGYPFMNEGAGGEVYHTLSYLACAPHQAGVIWAGTDDGYVHITRNDGHTWENITPPELEESLIHALELSPHAPGTAYVVATRYKFGDHRPFIFKTTDYGAHWTSITEGIGSDNAVRVVREDLLRPGLLYAGTERGLFISLNNGTYWQRFQLNLPFVLLTDLVLYQNNLIAATEGRSLWILDDLSPLQQLPIATGKEYALIQPSPAIRLERGILSGTTEEQGANPPDGMWIAYFIPEKLHNPQVHLEILNAQRQIIRRFSNQPDRNIPLYEGGPPRAAALPTSPGLNRFAWDLRRETLPGVPQVYIQGDYRGGLVSPGLYTLRLILNQDTLYAPARVLAHPGLPYPTTAYRDQEAFLLQIEGQIREIHESVARMRQIREQVGLLVDYFQKEETLAELVTSGQSLLSRINTWEMALLEPRQQTAQDVLNFPGKLSAECLELKAQMDGTDPRLTAGAEQRLVVLKAEWQQQRKRMDDILNYELARFKKIFQQKDIPGLIIPGVTAF